MLIQVAADDQRIPSLLGLSLPGQIAWIVIGMAFAAASVAAEHDESVLRWLRRAADFPELCWAGAAAAYGGLMALVPHGGLFGLVATVQMSQPVSTTVPKLTLEVVFVSLLVLPVVFDRGRPGLPRRILALPPVAGLGVISYSFYLWHLTIGELIALPHSQAFSASGLNLLTHVHVARGLILYIVTLAATVVVAWLSYRLVELPFLRRKERSARAASER